MFVSFCDDFFDKDVSNMLIYLNISQNGFDFEAADDQDLNMKDAFNDRMKKIEKELIDNEKKTHLTSLKDLIPQKDALGNLMDNIES